MSILHFTGFEQGNVRSSEGSDDYQPPAGSVSIQTTVKKNGSYSAEFDKVSAGTPYLAFPFNFTSEGKVDVNTNNKGTIYFTGYFRYSTKPSSGDEIILTMQGSNPVAELRLKSDGALVLYDTNYLASPVLLATSGTTLSADTWYRIGLKIVAGTSGSYELKIDGSSQFSASRTWLNIDNLGKIQVGCGIDRNTQSFKFYWDDLVASDTQYIDVDYAIKVIKPIADGSTQTWNGGTGASNYTQIDEIPIDDADYIMSPSSGNPNTALFEYESRATAGIDNGDIFAIKQVIICRENSSSGTTQTYMRLISGGTTVDTTQNNFTTSTQGLIEVYETDPNTSAAWTGSALDSIEAGVRENNGKQTRCISSLIYVLYEVQTSVNYPITASQGSIVLTGQSNILRVGKKIISALGSFVLSGQSNLLKRGIKMLASFTTFTLSGQSVIVKSARKILGAFGSFSLTGFASGLRIGKGLLAIMGTFTLTGQNATTTSTRKIISALGSFTLSGQTVLLKIGKTIQAIYGSFVLTGQSINIIVNKLLSAVYGVFTLTGYSAVLSKGKLMIALVGSYILTGQSILLKVGYKMLATYTTFVLSGQTVILKLGKGLIASYGSFTLTGQSILFHIAISIQAVYGQFVLTGQTVRFAINGLYIRWTTAVKNTAATFTTKIKNSASWINRNKNL